MVDDVYEFFGTVDLDPCCNNKENPNVKATVLYDEQDDGLSHSWTQRRVFMNHPYSVSKLWVPYAVQQFEQHNNEMLLLVKLDVSTKWWQSVASYPWLAYNKRLKFGEGTSAAPFQSAMIYLGANLSKFYNVFGKDGTIYTAF